jgi:hypothetical protein
MIDKLQVLETLLETMITEDEDITARAVCRRSDGSTRQILPEAQTGAGC